jgi:hypothetical protein
MPQYHIVRRVEIKVLTAWVVEAKDRVEAAAILAANPNMPGTVTTKVEQVLENPTGPYPPDWFADRKPEPLFEGMPLLPIIP